MWAVTSSYSYYYHYYYYWKWERERERERELCILCKLKACQMILGFFFIYVMGIYIFCCQGFPENKELNMGSLLSLCALILLWSFERILWSSCSPLWERGPRCDCQCTCMKDWNVAATAASWTMQGLLHMYILCYLSSIGSGEHCRFVSSTSSGSIRPML